MKRVFLLFFLVSISYSFLFAQKTLPFSEIDIPYSKFTLDNGLRVIIHEDHKAPVVAVNIWYHVGSKNEKPGRTGFAHLFEHLMFNGSEHFDDDYFKALDRIGATDLNGTTNEDRTNYFETVPVSAFEYVLWLESDRMGYMVNAISQEKLDEQRGVVQNEKRQYENEPYGLVEDYISAAVYPDDHPYSWTVIGSMEDLSAASLEDVKNWFSTYYGPNNAVLVVAGDIKTDEALEMVKKYFGAIPPGPPIVKMQEWVAKRSGSMRQVLQDRVKQERLYKVWNVAAQGSYENNMLQLVSQVLTSGKTSRLYKRLVYDEQLVSSIYSYVADNEIGSQFRIVTDIKPGVEIQKVNDVINEELEMLINNGPLMEELDRIKTKNYSSLVRNMERVGGFGGKSDILARSEVYNNDPDFYKNYMKNIAVAAPLDLQTAGEKWLSDGEYILEVHPYPELQASAEDVDRTKLPELGTPPEINFPEFERATLSNGLNVILAKRSTIPAVNFMLSVDAGYASDYTTIPGTAKLAMNLLDEGTGKRNSLQISEDLDLLGSNLSTGSSLDQSYISMSTLKINIDPSLEIFADVILNPSFPEQDLDRLRKDQLLSIQREKVQPIGMAFRIFPKYLYGENHPYGAPLTGSGFEDGVKNITRKSLIDYHNTWIRPNNSTLIVVGDIGMDELKPKLEKHLSSWKKAKVPSTTVPEVKLSEKPVIYLMDRPGSIQSLIIAGNLVRPFGEYNEAAANIMNSIIGGEFTSRINMNIREDKHWSYGAGSLIVDAGGQRPFLVYTSVQSDKTMETIQEINKELQEFISNNPASTEEIEKNKENQLLQIPGKYETMAAVASDMSTIVSYKLDDDYFEKYAENLRKLNLADVKSVSEMIISPGKMIWIVVGSRSEVEEPLKVLGYEIRHIDADGKIVGSQQEAVSSQ